MIRYNNLILNFELVRGLNYEPEKEIQIG